MATEQGDAAIAALYAQDFPAEQPGAEAEEAPIAQPEAAVETEPEGEAQHEAAPAGPNPEDSMNLDPEIPPDIQALLDEPDFEAEAEEEMEAEPEEDEVYLDDENEALAKKLKAAEKKLKWMEEQRAKSEGKRWQEEAEKYFPLAVPFLDKIQASSRRAFLRQANDYHERARKASEKVSPNAPSVDEKAIEAKVRAEYEAAWGKPVAGPGKAPVEAAEKQKAIEEARAKRDLIGIQKARGTTQRIWGPLYDHKPND